MLYACKKCACLENFQSPKIGVEILLKIFKVFKSVLLQNQCVEIYYLLYA